MIISLDPVRSLVPGARTDSLSIEAATDALLAKLGRCSSLTRLQLKRAETLTDASLSALSERHPSLSRLELEGASGVTGEGLASLQSLRQLAISRCDGITLKGLAAVRGKLSSLTLRMNAKLSSGLLEELSAWPGLEQLTLQVESGKGLGSVGSGTSLRRLCLQMVEGKRLTGEMVAALNALPDGAELVFLRANADEVKALATLRPGLRLSLGFASQGRNPDVLRDVDAVLSEVAALPGLHALNLGDKTVAKLGALAQCRSLQHLNLFGSDRVDADVEAIASLPLRSLNLNGRSTTQLSGSTVKRLAAMPTLQDLGLRELKVTDANLKTLAALPLRALDLGSSKMKAGDKGFTRLEEVRTLTRLKISSVGSTGLTNQTVRALAALPELEELELPLTAVDHATFELLAGFPALKRVSLRPPSVKLRDEWLAALSAAPALEVLDLSEYADPSALTLAGLLALEKTRVQVVNLPAYGNLGEEVLGGFGATNPYHLAKFAGRVVDPEERWWGPPFGD